MAIKPVEDVLRLVIADREATIEVLEVQLGKAREESERWQRKYLSAARVWPTVTVAFAAGLIGFAFGMGV